ncbi:HD domain-containing phosphohydrolase [Butyrivibrio sp. AE2032]|uniref:HD domain-containing phosphohydrolase n=1 Tax=Butyrivibrio sp. AE2032 TaxID=1458463 RepID=UPI000691B562|nr:HD-GYP domain-containing protein [Butyrivibrio sp. AE2032]
MKLDKTTETMLIFISVLVILLTSYYVERVCSNNTVASEYSKNLSLTGSRLSDEVYATVDKSADSSSSKGYVNSYEITIYNDSRASLSNWIAFLNVGENAKILDSWNAGVTLLDNGSLMITPEYYNLYFDPGYYIDFGFTLETKEAFFPTDIEFRAYSSKVMGGTIFRKIIYVALAIWAVLFVGFLVTGVNLRNYKEKQKNDVRIILQSMNTFISFIDAKDPYTRGHSRRVAMYAAEIAKRMRLSEDEIQNIYYAGLLHDAGKISIPDAVLNKPGVLTEEERKLIQDHTVAGGKMLKQLSSLRGIRETALYHHERYDGTGYPEGLKGESIPLYARIVGVADSYDAMSSNRVYRRHLNKDEIIEEIQQGSGTQFDPEIVSYMVDMINDGYVNVVKMETAEHEEGSSDFHLTEDDIPGVYMGF